MIALPVWIDDDLFVRSLVKATRAVMCGGSELWPLDGSSMFAHLRINCTLAHVYSNGSPYGGGDIPVLVHRQRRGKQP